MRTRNRIEQRNKWRRRLRIESLEARVVLAGDPVLTTLVGAASSANALIPDASFDAAVGESWKNSSYSEGTNGETWQSGKLGIGYDHDVAEFDDSGLYARYDASDPFSINGPGVDIGSDAITVLADVSGNGRDLVRVGALDEQPTFVEDQLNGLPSIRFDGGDYIWGNSSTEFGTLSQPATYVVVTKVDVQNGGYVFDSTSSSGRHAALTRNGGIEAWHMFAGSIVVGEPADLQLGEWQVHTFVFDGGSSEHYINGELSASGDVGAQSLNGLMLGSRFSLNFRMQGDIGEFLVFDRALDDSRRSEAESYLTQKWFEGGGGPSYTDLIQTDVRTSMLETNSSAYVRIPFPVDNGQFDGLSLNVRYDDGFVAYLNGTEVTRRNAPGPVGAAPTYNATATGVRPKTAAIADEVIDISEHIGLLSEGEDNVLAIHGLNVDASDVDFLVLPTLVGSNDPLEVVATNPTDGEFLGAPPTNITVDFSLPIDPTSVDATDLQVAGVSATSVTIIDDDSVVFSLAPVATGGIIDVTIPSGAITATNGQLMQPYLGTFVLPVAATIESLPPLVLGANFVDARGDVVATGGQDPRVTVYYGTSDGGEVASNWQSQLDLGVIAQGEFAGRISDLQPNTPYFYRFFAVNESGGAWATTSRTFNTLSLPLVAISEFMASNEAGMFVDEDGNDSDWIEIHNPGPAPVDLAGWHLTDDADELTKWTFPSETLSEGEFLVVFASSNDRGTSGSELHTNFQLSSSGEYLAFVRSDGATVESEFVSNDGEYPRQITDVSFGRTTSELDGSSGDYYMQLSTPGTANVPGQLGFVGDTSFSVDRGFYTFEDLFGVLQNGVTISVPDEARATTQIIYTTDGSVPEVGAPGTRTYDGPVSIGTTTTLRAKAIAAGYVPTNVDTHTYIFTDDVLLQDGVGLPALTGTDYEMDPTIVNDPRYASLMEDLKSLPTVSFVLPVEDIFGPGGIIENPTQTGRDWEREASVEMIFPDGSEGFQVNAGLRIQGAGSRARSFSKKGFQLFFRGEYGAKKLEFPFFGPEGSDAFDRIAFRGNFFDSYTVNNAGAIGTACCGYNQAMLLRDQFGHQTHADMGSLAIDGNWVHLYLNGQYWGLYNPIERPDATFAETYLGGNADDYDVLKQRPRGQANGSPPEVVQGDLAAWNELMSLINQDIATDIVYDQVDDLMNLEDFADYIILNVFGGNFDWPHNNWYAMRERTPDAKWTFISWDAENFIFDVNADRSEVNTNNSPGIIYSRLRQNEEFRLLFADRVQEHFFNEGALTPDANIERFELIANDIRSAMNAESARWGDTHVQPPRNTVDHFDPLVENKIGSYFPRRTEIVLDQFRADGLYPQITAPVFDVNGVDKHGGHVDTGDAIGMTAAVDVVYQDTVLVTQGSPVTVLVPTDDSLETGPELWYEGELDTSDWISGTNGVGYEDVASTYAPLIETDIANAWNATETSVYTRFEFALDDGFQPTDFESALLRMKYDDGFVAYLNGSEILRVNAPAVTNWQSNSLASHPDNLAINFVAFDITDHLDHLGPGENLLAIHGLNQTNTSSDFLILPELVLRNQQTVSSAPIYFTTDGTDPRDENGAAAGTLFTSAIEVFGTIQLTARAFTDGQWSALSQATFSPGGNLGTVIITELNYNPTDPSSAELDLLPGIDNDEFEFIEVTNVHPTRTVNVVGWTLEDGISFTFPNATLSPGERALIVENQEAFEVRYGDDLNVLGEWSGGLSNSGEDIELRASDRELLNAFEYSDRSPWPERADGAGASLESIEPTRFTRLDKYYQWQGSTEFGGSPGAPNSVPLGVVINEVRTRNDAPSTHLDAIELMNSSPDAVDISGWYLSDAAGNLLKYVIPAGTILQAGEYIVFDESHFNTNPAAPGPNDFALSGASGDDVWLVTSDDGQTVTSFVDDVHFGASVNGGTLGRVPNSSGQFVPSARSLIGCQNVHADVGNVVISEINYGSVFHEFVEITNASSEFVDLTGWRLNGGIEFDFDDLLGLSAGESLVVLSFNPLDPDNDERLASFVSEFAISPGEVQILGGFQGRLSNNFDYIRLERPDESPPDDPAAVPMVTVDQVLYDDKRPWPLRADGLGDSLQRRSLAFFGNASSSWGSDLPTPGFLQEFATTIGDLTGDDVVDAADIDLLNVMINRGRTLDEFDLDGSGVVDAADRKFLVENIVGTFMGDANLDSQVNAQDLNSVGIHWQQANDCLSWASGDFDGDRDVDAADLNEIGLNWQKGTAPAVVRVPRAPLHMWIADRVEADLRNEALPDLALEDATPLDHGIISSVDLSDDVRHRRYRAFWKFSQKRRSDPRDPLTVSLVDEALIDWWK